MSFESELKQLQKNLLAKLEKAEKQHRPVPGHDDGVSNIRRPILNEYNKKLEELKTKYDVQ